MTKHLSADTVGDTLSLRREIIKRTNVRFCTKKYLINILACVNTLTFRGYIDFMI